METCPNGAMEDHHSALRPILPVYHHDIHQNQYVDGLLHHQRESKFVVLFEHQPERRPLGIQESLQVITWMYALFSPLIQRHLICFSGSKARSCKTQCVSLITPLRPMVGMSNYKSKLGHALACTLSQGLSQEEGNSSLFHFHALETHVFQLIGSLGQPRRLALSNRCNISWKSACFCPTSLLWLRGLTEVDFISIIITR